MADNNLFPVVEIPEFTEQSDSYDTQYHPSLKWDLKEGDFVRTASGRVPRSDGKEGYRIWCVKSVATERLSCLAYADDIGTEMEKAAKEEDRSAVELAIQRTIEEALMVNPRTVKVDGFTFEWSGESVYVSFMVTAVDDQRFTISTAISAT